MCWSREHPPCPSQEHFRYWHRPWPDSQSGAGLGCAVDPVHVGGPVTVTATTVPPGLATGVTYNGSTVAPTNAGSYTVVATIADTNYLASATNTLTIAPAVAGVTFGNTAQTYTGSPEPITVATVPAGLATTVTYNGSPTIPQSVGSYTVAATVNDPNYTGSATSLLTINPLGLTIILTNLNQTYDGVPKIVVAQSTPATSLKITYNGSSIAPTNTGSYAVSATPVSTNYSGSATGTLVIGQAAATITLSGLTQTMTGSTIAVTATTVPARLATSITYNGSSTAPIANGRYTVVGTVTDANYSGSVTNTLIIQPMSPTGLRIVGVN